MRQEDISNPEKRNFKVVSREKFIASRDKLDVDLFAFLTPHTEADYEDNGTRLFLSQDTLSGFGINPNGELISVFSLERARGKILVEEARKLGAVSLSCMGDHLHKLYSDFGFSPVKIVQWDNQFAPKHWNYERFGAPNIYDMRLVNPYTAKLTSSNSI